MPDGVVVTLALQVPVAVGANLPGVGEIFSFTILCVM
mgnify:CR=1 FL=1